MRGLGWLITMMNDSFEIRFCATCERDDYAAPLKDRHYMRGKLCSGVPITVDYALVTKRQHLESALATAFVSMQGTLNAGERQRLWLECLRLAGELEKLNEHN